MHLLNEDLCSNYHSKVKWKQKSEENPTSLEDTAQSPTADSISVVASAPVISYVVSPRSISPSDAISAAEILMLLRNIVSPEI